MQKKKKEKRKKGKKETDSLSVLERHVLMLKLMERKEMMTVKVRMAVTPGGSKGL